MVYVEPFGTYPRLLWPPSTGSYSPEKVIKASRISMVEFYVNGEVYVRGLPNALPLFGYYGQIDLHGSRADFAGTNPSAIDRAEAALSLRSG